AESWMEGGHFGHGFASGFDWPWLGITAPGADRPLSAPFAVTIELAWSSKAVGAVWVEENWLVTKDGPENLTASVPRTIAADAHRKGRNSQWRLRTCTERAAGCWWSGPMWASSPGGSEHRCSSSRNHGWAQTTAASLAHSVQHGVARSTSCTPSRRT